MTVLWGTTLQTPHLNKIVQIVQMKKKEKKNHDWPLNQYNPPQAKGQKTGKKNWIPKKIGKKKKCPEHGDVLWSLLPDAGGKLKKKKGGGLWSQSGSGGFLIWVGRVVEDRNAYLKRVGWKRPAWSLPTSP